MLSLGSLAFAAPWLLLGLIALPILWWLLRVTPPAPRRIRFPAIRLLLGLEPREETPAKTPLWLIILRMVLAALVILALAQPLLNPTARFAGSGPVLIVVDDGWSAARQWADRQNALLALVDRAQREDRQVIIAGTAPQAGGEAARPLDLMRAGDARGEAQAMAPKPWPVDRRAAAERIAALGLERANVVWLSDGLEDGQASAFAEQLQHLGSLTVLTDSPERLARILRPSERESTDLAVSVRRASAPVETQLTVRASAEDGRMLARETVSMAAGILVADVRLAMPSELRNRAARIDIEGENAAGGAFLLDERWRRRPVGVVAARPVDSAQPLLAETYYIERALNPFSEVRRGGIGELLQRELAVLVLADAIPGSPAERQSLVRWIEEGGVLLRFAGPNLAENADDMLPVQIRRGGRTLGGALTWERPAALAAFPPESPFAGLAIPEDVTVTRQVLAEPTLDLAGKTWARLADGTPLVTAERRGSGWVVLVHTSANTAWSSLPLSGLFVDMLRRLVGLSQGIGGAGGEGTLPPLETLDAFGRLQPAPATARPIAARQFAEVKADAAHPPGFYGTADSKLALNLASAVPEIKAIERLPDGVAQQEYARGQEIDFRPWLLGAALMLALIDLVIAYALRGLLPRPRRRATAAAIALAAALAAAGPALAQRAGTQSRGTAAPDDNLALQATLEMRLAYVRTGIGALDEVSHAGLAGLSAVLNRRTAVETADPMGVDLERDELVFFPLIYWPIAPEQPALSPTAVEKLNQFMATGGTIVFDTRDAGERGTGLSGSATERLRQVVAGLQIPALVPVPPDHVLTKSFYLMQEFPGRWSGGKVWLEPAEDRVNDGVSTVIIGGNDWASAWAVDGQGRAIFPFVPGGEAQREMAYRFGVNLVMYALTGNYKTDQVHVPAILERLGQ